MSLVGGEPRGPEKAEVAARPLLEEAVRAARRVGTPDVEAEALADLAEGLPDDAVEGGDVPRHRIGCLEAAVAALAGSSSDKAVLARIRLAGALVCAGRREQGGAVLAPARQRFAWRLSAAEGAELALVVALVDGADTTPARAALGGRLAPAVARLVTWMDRPAYTTPG